MGDLTRRDVLSVAGLVGLGVLVPGCSAADGTTTAGASRTASGSPDPTIASSAKPTYAQLAKQLSGTLSLPGQSGYQPKSLLYNPRFSTQHPPSAIAHVASAADVAACVKFAADGGASLRIRNGGHSYGGWSSGSGLVVDLAQLNTVKVAANGKTATVGAGALLADVYSRLGSKGVSIGGGSCATVGVTGLALGGGVGVLARTYGLTCDQLASVQVVTADGRVRTVDAHTDPDLFWALRGGGGSFGAVTRLTFNVRPAPRIQTFFLQWTSLSAAEQVLSAWQHWMAGAPRELWSTCKLLVEPGQGSRVLVAGTWVGSGSPASRLTALLAQTPRPSRRGSGGGSYAATMLSEAGCSGETASACISKSLSPAYRQPFSATSSILQAPLPSAGVRAIVQAAGEGAKVKGMVEGGVSFDAFGGAIADVAPDATAFPWRTALADVQYTATWPYAGAGQNPAPFDNFVQAQRKALQPWLGNSAYVNYADPKLNGFAEAYWGTNLARLSQVKKSYDPHDVFSFPQSVPV
ncbi:MAG: FAD-binding oxidoreductase [Micropruina sp.]